MNADIYDTFVEQQIAFTFRAKLRAKQKFEKELEKRYGVLESREYNIIFLETYFALDCIRVSVNVERNGDIIERGRTIFLGIAELLSTDSEWNNYIKDYSSTSRHISSYIKRYDKNKSIRRITTEDNDESNQISGITCSNNNTNYCPDGNSNKDEKGIAI